MGGATRLDSSGLALGTAVMRVHMRPSRRHLHLFWSLNQGVLLGVLCNRWECLGIAAARQVIEDFSMWLLPRLRGLHLATACVYCTFADANHPMSPDFCQSATGMKYGR